MNRFSDRSSILLVSTIPDHHLMKVKWWSFLIFKGMYFICKTENIKNIEGYGDIALKQVKTDGFLVCLDLTYP